MNKAFAFLVLFLALCLPAMAQVLQPAKFTVTVSNPSPKPGEVIELIVKTTIDEGWYVYGSDFDPNLGPNLTVVNFAAPKGYAPKGKLKGIGLKRKHDDVWDGEISYFKQKGEFRQSITITDPAATVTGTVEGQVCTDKDGKCIPFSHDFSIKLKGGAGAKPAGKAQSLAEPAIEPATPASAEPVNTATTASTPTDSSRDGGVNSGGITAGEKGTVADSGANNSAAVNTHAGPAPNEKALLDQANEASNSSVWGFFVLAFLSGLAALITPCVFPLIPMTVSIFTKYGSNRSEGIRKALFYGFSIIAIYTFIGTIVSRINGPEFANFLSTHWFPNVAFFVIFILFGISFLGAFEIVLPQAFVNRVDREADKGGYYGIFFMAFTLALVSFSCTGPIVGQILVLSAGGEVIKPIIGMLGFSLAFAIPFTLFAVFPKALQSLPRSGSWLNSVKVVLGFLELALALKFLSVADQAYHWRLLDREVYLAAWIAIFTLLGLYFLGKITMPHDSKSEKTSVTGLLLAVVTFSFVIYLIPGMFGAPLKALAGYLPPQHTIDFDLSRGAAMTAKAASTTCDPKPRHSESLHMPHGLHGYFDYKEALACAQKQNKPIFIDFTGHGCVNCREMEARVWSDPQVLQRLNEKFVMLALYVDDKTQLPEKEWYVSKYDGKQKTTLGKKNADLQITRFNNNAQPYYVLLSPQGQLLVAPRAYNLDVKGFIDFLDSGLAAMTVAGPRQP